VATRNKCEDCEARTAGFGLEKGGRRRWCGGCAQGHGGAAVNVVTGKPPSRGCPPKAKAEAEGDAEVEVAWEAQLARLAAYKAEHGDCNVPQGWAEDPRLAQWVSLQRGAHLAQRRTHTRKLDRGEPSARMTAERAGRLAALGCDWGFSEQEQEQERARVMGPSCITPR
jgi:hypothetical protein